MAMIAPMAVAGMMAGRAYGSRGLIESLRNLLISKLKRYIKQNHSFIANAEKFNRFHGKDKESVEVIEKTRLLMQEQIAELIKQVTEGNKTLAKRKKIQKTVWYAKLSTKQKILATLRLLKQQKVKNVK